MYSLSVLAPDPDASEDSRSQIQQQLREFILEFRLDNAFIYRYVNIALQRSPADTASEIRFERTFLSSNTIATSMSPILFPTTKS